MEGNYLSRVQIGNFYNPVQQEKNKYSELMCKQIRKKRLQLWNCILKLFKRDMIFNQSYKITSIISSFKNITYICNT